MHSKKSHPGQVQELLAWVRDPRLAEPALQSAPSAGSYFIWPSPVSPARHPHPQSHEVGGPRGQCLPAHFRRLEPHSGVFFQNGNGIKDGFGGFRYKQPLRLCGTSFLFPFFYPWNSRYTSSICNLTCCGQSQWEGSWPAQKIFCCNHNIPSFIELIGSDQSWWQGGWGRRCKLATGPPRRPQTPECLSSRNWVLRHWTTFELDRWTTTPKRIQRLLKPWAPGRKHKAKTKTTTQFLSGQVTLPWERILRNKYCLILWHLLLTLTSLSLHLTENPRKEREEREASYRD